MTPLCIYLSLGSNLGDRAANLRAAIAALPSANLHVRKVSSFYETEPVDYLDQPWFLNCVVEGATDSQPIDLLRALRAIEEIYEPYLMQIGMIDRTPRGRVATPRAYQYFGKELPRRQPRLF